LSDFNKNDTSIFDNVLHYENATTELLRNLLLRDKDFCEAFISLFFPEESNIRIDESLNIETQHRINNENCIPDLWIETDEYIICIEVKTSSWTNLTKNQPCGYLRELRKETKKWKLFLLAPEDYLYKTSWEGEYKEGYKNNIENPVFLRETIITWTKVLKKNKDLKLSEKNVILKEWEKYIENNLVPVKIKLEAEEAEIMFDTNTAIAVSKTIRIIHEVHKKLKEDGELKVKPTNRITNNLTKELGFYFLDDDGNYALWFGMWFPYWKEKGSPLAIGMDEEYNKEAIDKFKDLKKHEEFDDYYMIPIKKEILEKEDSITEISGKVTDIINEIF
jgi:hypothetical protein